MRRDDTAVSSRELSLEIALDDMTNREKDRRSESSFAFAPLSDVPGVPKTSLKERSSAMKIRETAPVASPQRVNAAASPAPDANNASTATTERVTLGASANLRKTVGEARTQAASDRHGRIRDLAQAVRGGAYKPDARDIAGAMLETSDLDAQLSELTDAR